MNRRNYQRELDRIIEKNGGARPRVLLHVCCGPCSSSVLEYLTQYFDVTILWYNPNIYPEAEFERRFRTLVKLVEDMGLADRVSILAEPHKSGDYYSRVKGLEDEPEGGRAAVHDVHRCRASAGRLQAQLSGAAEQIQHRAPLHVELADVENGLLHLVGGGADILPLRLPELPPPGSSGDHSHGDPSSSP